MILGRNTFFVLLFVLFAGPFYAYKVIWLATSKPAVGRVYFVGHTLELQNGISQHLVILYKTDNYSGTFNIGYDSTLQVGETVPIRYQKNDPSDVKLNTPLYIWGGTVVDSLVPLIALCVLYLTPTFLDPLVPWKSRVRIGRKPFIKIIPGNA